MLRRLVLVQLSISALLCLTLLGARVLVSDRATYSFLAWNLFLAAIPLALAYGIENAAQRRLPPVVSVLALLWLLFFPNAPYVVTDFVHLGPDPPVPLWLDVLLFSTFAWTSLILGFYSVYRLRVLARGRAGAWAGRVGLFALFAASSFAIYLGRFQQWNSWDLLVRPLAVAADVVSLHAFGRKVGFVVGFTAFLTVAYATFEALVDIGAPRGAAPPNFRRCRPPKSPPASR